MISAQSYEEVHHGRIRGSTHVHTQAFAVNMHVAGLKVIRSKRDGMRFAKYSRDNNCAFCFVLSSRKHF